MTEILVYDPAAARRVERIYRSADIVEQRHRVLRMLAPSAGERILDVGCGPGFLVCDLAAAVGPTGMVHGVDTADAMLAHARRRRRSARTHGVIALDRADASALPFVDGSFDAAVVTQAYEFVPNVAAALRELRRVLQPGGRAVILDTDWHTAIWHSGDDERTRRVLDAWMRRLAHPHLPRTLETLLRDAGFDIDRSSAWTILDTHGHGSSYSSQQADHIAASLRRTNPWLDADAWAADVHDLADRGEYFFSVSRFVFRAIAPRRAPTGHSGQTKTGSV